MLQIMTKEMSSKPKPLSFSTTMRNPGRIASFLNQILPFENYILTNEIIMRVVHNNIRNKLYKPNYIKTKAELNDIYESDELFFNDNQVNEIIENSPQDHKEAGFDKGWPSRFDTWYNLPKEFGFLYYEIGKPIKISTIGHMLIDALNEETPNEKKIQNVFLNSMMKYQSNNPFRKNSNSNVPLLLLLKVIKLLKDDPEENDAGIYRQELSLLICWPNDNASDVYNKIKSIRKQVGYNYSDEFIYDICLEILGCLTEEEKEKNKNYYKMNKICGEAVDEYIRKMRSTGILSLRGNGRFLDFNSFEQKKIDYILDNYSSSKKFDNCLEYYEYVSEVDNNILDSNEGIEQTKEKEIKLKTLEEFSKKYSKDKVYSELQKLVSKTESQDEVLKFISAPTRLEFLTSIALMQNFNNIIVIPSYPVDDEGLPTMTAGRDVPDIYCYDNTYQSLFEVTLMRSKDDQIYREILPIKRHLLDMKKQCDNIFSVFIAPIIHSDAKDAAEWIKYKENVDIITMSIAEMIESFKRLDNLKNLLD